jgi:glyoxylase-like metal-dependent hydrolase (beta-lactamase superfamily II)
MIGQDGSDYLDDFHFHPIPGHSAGHMSISLESGGETTIFSGDVMHSPMQVYRPEWNSLFCAQQEPLRASSRWFLELAVVEHATVFTAHYPQTSAGVAHGPAPGFKPGSCQQFSASDSPGHPAPGWH